SHRSGDTVEIETTFEGKHYGVPTNMTLFVALKYKGNNYTYLYRAHDRGDNVWRSDVTLGSEKSSGRDYDLQLIAIPNDIDMTGKIKVKLAEIPGAAEGRVYHGGPLSVKRK